jgi:hypothetical protein
MFNNQNQFNPIAIPNNVPVYRVGSEKFYADDELFEEGSIISWELDPNEGFQPLNDLAFKKMEEFFKKIDKHEEKVCKENRRQFISKLNEFYNRYNLNNPAQSRRVTQINAPIKVPVLGQPIRKEVVAKRITPTAPNSQNFTPADFLDQDAELNTVKSN